jgi:hypothetical protein
MNFYLSKSKLLETLYRMSTEARSYVTERPNSDTSAVLYFLKILRHIDS